jgi:hypothetical protein
MASECAKCGGVMHLKVSSKKESEGKRYLKCDRCGRFDWFCEDDARKKENVKVTLEGNLSDFCDLFAKNNRI